MTAWRRAINLDQYSDALAVVKHEYERIRPSKFQRILFVLFNVSVYGAIILFFVSLLLVLIPGFTRHQSGRKLSCWSKSLRMP